MLLTPRILLRVVFQNTQPCSEYTRPGNMMPWPCTTPLCTTPNAPVLRQRQHQRHVLPALQHGPPCDSRKQPAQGGSGLCARPWLLPLATQLYKGGGAYRARLGKICASSLGLFFARLDRLLTVEQAKPVPASTAEQRITHGHSHGQLARYIYRAAGLR